MAKAVDAECEESLKTVTSEGMRAHDGLPNIVNENSKFAYCKPFNSNLYSVSTYFRTLKINLKIKFYFAKSKTVRFEVYVSIFNL